MLVSRRYYCEKSNDRHPIVAFSGRTLHGPSVVKSTDPEGIYLNVGEIPFGEYKQFFHDRC